MNKKTTHPIFFSPTGTTRSIIRSINRGIGRSAENLLDITQKAPSGLHTFSQKNLVIVGMPVYGGRLPKIATERFQTLKGESTPVVAVVVYGNRAYGDALTELCDLCVAQGFRLAGAGTFIGQHSFSSAEFPIAHGRPDRQDVSQAEQFGRQIQMQLEDSTSWEILKIHGNRPYKPEMQPIGAATETDLAECTHCGACAAHCPTQCIRMEDGIPKTTAEDCIWCLACIQHCPTKARKIILPKIHEIAQRLHTDCQTRREPEIFHPLQK